MGEHQVFVICVIWNIWCRHSRYAKDGTNCIFEYCLNHTNNKTKLRLRGDNKDDDNDDDDDDDDYDDDDYDDIGVVGSGGVLVVVTTR